MFICTKNRLQLCNGVEESIKQLHPKYNLAIVSDGQTAYALPKMTAVGLFGIFESVIISGNFGFHKPDPLLFENALTIMQMKPSAESNQLLNQTGERL